MPVLSMATLFLCAHYDVCIRETTYCQYTQGFYTPFIIEWYEWPANTGPVAQDSGAAGRRKHVVAGWHAVCAQLTETGFLSRIHRSRQFAAHDMPGLSSRISCADTSGSASAWTKGISVREPARDVMPYGDIEDCRVIRNSISTPCRRFRQQNRGGSDWGDGNNG